MKTAAKLYQIGSLGFYLYVLNHLQKRHFSVGIPDEIEVIRNVRIFSPRFLTNWTFALQGIYFALCTLSNFLSLIPNGQKIGGKIYEVSNFIFTAIATPAALMVTLMFWGLYAIDRDLIFPKALDIVLPPWLNHSIHSLNTVLALGDMYLVHHKYPSWANVFKGQLSYFIIYSVCLFGTYFQTGIWLYPFLEQLTWTFRMVFGLAVFAGALSVYALTKFINRMLWGSAPAEKTRKINKHKTKKSS